MAKSMKYLKNYKTQIKEIQANIYEEIFNLYSPNERVIIVKIT